MLVRPLTPDLKQKAEERLNETPKKLEDGIRHLKEYISKQPHLRARTDDQWLAAFLRGCKHSLERAKDKLDLYYSLRTVSPDFFTFRPNNQRFKYLLQTGPLTSELKQKAEEELNETLNKLEDGIKHLKEWISKQPHLRARTDDQWLAAFLRGCKHSLERAKKKLDLYYSIRTVSPDLFTFRPNNQHFKYLLQTGAGMALPKLASPLAPRVVLIKPSLYDPYMISPTDFFSLAYCCQQVMFLEDDAFMVNGNIGVIDLEGITMTHLKRFTPTIVKKLVIIEQDASPIRLKSLHIINAIPACEKLFYFAKKLLNEKHQKRVYLHSTDLRGLQEYIPTEILPQEYGGKGGTRQEITDYWLKKIDQYGYWFDEDWKFGTDETKRLGNPKTAENMFGVKGSFRQLDVD